MVLRTLVKLGTRHYPKTDLYMPGFCSKTIKHHASVIPLYGFTVAGIIACTAYCYKLGAYQDTGLRKVRERPDVKPSEGIPLITQEEVANLKTLTEPANRPSL